MSTREYGHLPLSMVRVSALFKILQNLVDDELFIRWFNQKLLSLPPKMQHLAGHQILKTVLKRRHKQGTQL